SGVSMMTGVVGRRAAAGRGLFLPDPDRGLDCEEAARRLGYFGRNEVQQRTDRHWALRLLGLLASPLNLLLLIAAGISLFLQEWPDAVIVLSVLAGSTLLGGVQEFLAGDAMRRLQSRLSVQAVVLRDGEQQRVPMELVVPGDVVCLTAGSLIPADGVVLQADDLFVSEAALTGEVYPVEKRACRGLGEMPRLGGGQWESAGVVERVLMGTNVRSGYGRVLVLRTGAATALGGLADRLRRPRPETEFERGVREFGMLLMRVMLLILPAVLAVNMVFARPAAESLLFALALAVGLAPELLPAIITMTLSHGARRMARSGVLVRRLSAIENFGCMDVLCTDKTGTLTVGEVQLREACDVSGAASGEVLRLACLNAILQSGLRNPLDEALSTAARGAGMDLGAVERIDEIPWDFTRKRVSVVLCDTRAGMAAGLRMVTKGAFRSVISVCTTLSRGALRLELDAAGKRELEERFAGWSRCGLRVLAVATREISERREQYCRDEERGLCFEGFLLFEDPAKPGAAEALRELRERGVQLKMITGDNSLIAVHVAESIGMPVTEVLTGADLNGLSDEVLWHRAAAATVFAEVDPGQKERIIRSLKESGHVVGYLGDGINDAPALHAADVSISVENAVDVAREAAEIVLLRPDLGILRGGIDEGRRTFANTQKYILTTISANFGNMLSMAVASAVLPFLPLLASQILLNNFLSDIPGAAIAADAVDVEWIRRPRRWNTRELGRFMLVFGAVSSVFDLLTFALLLKGFGTAAEEFRTGWFVESLLTELAVALVIRTHLPCYRSRPGRWLTVTTLLVAVVAVLLPYLPVSSQFGFVRLPPGLLVALLLLTLAYVIVVELTKMWFFRKGRRESLQVGVRVC
ncbi:MAG: magnesium-translocating P-type ATPase, partial [Planctomycetota bacterium]